MKYSKLIRPRDMNFDYDNKMRRHMNKFRGYVLDKPIHIYRMWYHFVRLVIDCEENDIIFGGEKKRRVKLNQKFYSQWNLEMLLSESFDKWFAQKVHLFAEDKPTIVKESDDSTEHLYIRFHKNSRKEDVIRDVRKLLKQGKFKTTAKFIVKKQHKYLNLHQQYNVFLLRQSGATYREIRDWLVKHYKTDITSTGGFTDATINRIIRTSEQVLVDCSKGKF